MPDEDALSVDSLFAEPPKQHISFSLRKRKKDQDDTLSAHSLSMGDDVPKKKRLGKVASLANLLSSSPISKPLQNAKQAFKRSISGMLHPVPAPPSTPTATHDQCAPLNERSPTPSTSSIPNSPSLNQNKKNLISMSRSSTSTNLTPYRPPALTPTKHRPIRLWSETWGKQTVHALTNQDIKRQEAIYELWHGECDLIEDISMLQRNYHDSLVHLGLLTKVEADLIFGSIMTLLPVHNELKEVLKKAKGFDGSIESVAEILLKWVPKLEVYVVHCGSQVRAKSALDEKRSSDPRVEDFLTRCLESPFSRRLDVWSYLDVPRSRLVKYPLLIKQILKYTSDTHTDAPILSRVLEILSNILDRVDKATGLARCRQVIGQIDMSDDMRAVLSQATTLICEGQLKTIQGLKLQCFLFDSSLVLTRSQPPNRLILYKNIFEAATLKVTDLGTKVGRNNSFLPGSSGSGVALKHVFKVESASENITLVTHNEHNKKQWILGLKRVTEERRDITGNTLDRETSDTDNGHALPKIKPSLIIKGTNKNRKALPRGKLQVTSTPQLPSHVSALPPTTRFLRSKGSICLNETLSPGSHRICTRSCTNLKFAAANRAGSPLLK